MADQIMNMGQKHWEHTTSFQLLIILRGNNLEELGLGFQKDTHIQKNILCVGPRHKCKRTVLLLSGFILNFLNYVYTLTHVRHKRKVANRSNNERDSSKVEHRK